MKIINRSISLSIIASIILSVAILAISLVYLQSQISLLKHKNNTKKLVNEQISLITKKLDSFSMINQIDYITETVYRLNQVEQVSIFDKNCKLLRKQPINNNILYSCNKNDHPNNTVFYESDIIYSSSENMPKYIIASIKYESFSFLSYDFLIPVIITILSLLFITIILLVLFKKLILSPVNYLSESITKNTTKLYNSDNVERLLPIELKPIYKSVLYRDSLIHEANKKIISQQKLQAAIDISRQVAHDIKSPIGTIDVALKYFKRDEAKATKLLTSGLERIKSILNDLENVNNKNYLTNKETNITNIVPLIYEIVEEKKEISNDIRIDFKASFSEEILCKVHDTTFKRIISNIINNSIEAINTEGFISVTLEISGNNVLIYFTDSGKGMPDEISNKIFKKEISFGKSRGQGLGLFHAYTNIKDWDGEIEFCKEMENTTLRITLPIYSDVSI